MVCSKLRKTIRANLLPHCIKGGRKGERGERKGQAVRDAVDRSIRCTEVPTPRKHMHGGRTAAVMPTYARHVPGAGATPQPSRCVRLKSGNE